MFARWPDVDMRAANVAVLEQRERVEYRDGGNAVKSGSIPRSHSGHRYRRINGREHIANCGFGLVHQRHLQMYFTVEGCRERNGRGTSARKLCGALLSAWTSVERRFTQHVL
jgi:hypothetical protein